METKRIEGLDVWRTVFLFFGVCLHTADAEHVPIEGMVGIITNMFRMGAFMAIAGAMAGIALNSKPPELWYKNKLAQLGIPLAACAIYSNLLLYPLTKTLYLYHVWFLICLIEYCTLLYFGSAYVAGRVSKPSSLRFLKRIKLIPAMIVLMVITMGLNTVTHLALLYFPTMSRTTELVSQSVQFIIPFFLGYAYGKYAEVREFANSNRAGLLILILISVIPMAVFIQMYGHAELYKYGKHQTSLRMLTNSAVMYPIICLVFQQAFKPRQYPKFFYKIAKSSYTVYLVHLPIATYCLLYFPKSGSPFLDYCIRIIFVSVTSYGVYRLVKKNRITELLFSGKLDALKAARQTFRSRQPAPAE